MTPPIGETAPMRRRSSRRQVTLVFAVGVVALGIIIVAPRAWQSPQPTISEAGFVSTDYIVIGGSRVADQGTAQFKESLLRVEGGDLRGVGSIVRVAQQHQGRPLDCLGERYDGDEYWTSSTPATGHIEFREADTLAVVGTIELSVIVDEVVRRPLAVDPICQAVSGTYRGVDGSLAGVAGSVTAGFAPGRIDQFWHFDARD